MVGPTTGYVQFTGYVGEKIDSSLFGGKPLNWNRQAKILELHNLQNLDVSLSIHRGGLPKVRAGPVPSDAGVLRFRKQPEVRSQQHVATASLSCVPTPMPWDSSGAIHR
jgi:hypothetical protein